MKDLLIYLTKSLVKKPDVVQVSEKKVDNETIEFTLHVDPDDMGRIIGRNGKTARAIRTLMSARALTDNKNRTVAEVRHAFSKFGGNLGADGSVSYLFNNVGQLLYAAGSDEDAVMEAAIDAGAEDVVVDDDHSIEVLTDPDEFESVRDKMIESGHEPENAQLTMRASTSAELGVKEATSMIKLLELLEDLDDVQEVYSNADISNDVLAQI